MMLKLNTVGLVAVALGALALGACDDDGDGDSATTMPTTATTPMTMTATDGETDDTMETMDTMEDGSSGDEIDCSAAPSHATDIQPIWDASCVAGCHEPGGSWQTTDLTDGAAYDALVDADGVQTQAVDHQLVTPGDVELSYLLNKLNNTQADVAGGAAGTQMPQGMAPLSAEQIALVELWVACGAEE